MEYLLEAPVIYETNEELEVSNPVHLHSHILSTVFQSRGKYISNVMGASLKKMFEDGYGFYVTLSQVQNHEPLNDKKYPVHVKSYVKKYFQRWESSRVHVPFELTHLENQKVLASGTLEFAVVDVKESKSRLLPKSDWKYFSHNTDENGAPISPLDRENSIRPKALNVEKAEKTFRIVKDHEIDMYKHVGTTNYIRYVYETLSYPLEFTQSLSLFKRSLLKDNDFVVLTEKKEDSVLFEIRDPTLKTVYNIGSLSRSTSNS